MKQIASNYSYSPTTNVVTLAGVNIDQDQLLLIVAPGVGRTLYNFASVTGTVVAGADTRVALNASTAGLTTTSPLVIFYDDHVPATSVTGTVALDPASLIALENITVTVGSSVALAAGSAQVGSVTISNFPSTQTIAGTVTANGGDFFVQGLNSGLQPYTKGVQVIGTNHDVDLQFPLNVDDLGQVKVIAGANSLDFPISGTVTANISGDVVYTEDPNGLISLKAAVYAQDSSLELQPVGANNPMPISGTVTANNPNGALTTRFGSVATANLAFITSAVTNTSRKYLLAQNISAGTVTIGIGFSPTTTQGIQLSAGGGLTFDAFCPTGAVYWLGAVTGAAFTILEG